MSERAITLIPLAWHPKVNETYAYYKLDTREVTWRIWDGGHYDGTNYWLGNVHPSKRTAADWGRRYEAALEQFRRSEEIRLLPFDYIATPVTPDFMRHLRSVRKLVAVRLKRRKQ